MNHLSYQPPSQLGEGGREGERERERERERGGGGGRREKREKEKGYYAWMYVQCVYIFQTYMHIYMYIVTSTFHNAVCLHTCTLYMMYSRLSLIWMGP